MGVIIEEQETVIQLSRSSDRAYIYTSDTTMIHKFDKLVCSSDEWKIEDTGTINGEVVSKEYSCPKKFVSLRSKKRQVSEKQRESAAKRMKEYQRLRRT